MLTVSFRFVFLSVQCEHMLYYLSFSTWFAVTENKPFPLCRWNNPEDIDIIDGYQNNNETNRERYAWLVGSFVHFISVGLCKEDVTPVLYQWNYVFLALTYRYNVPSCVRQGLYFQPYNDGLDCLARMRKRELYMSEVSMRIRKRPCIAWGELLGYTWSNIAR